MTSGLNWRFANLRKVHRQFNHRRAAAAQLVEQSAQVQRVGRIKLEKRSGDFIGHLPLAEFFKRPNEASTGFEKGTVCSLGIQKRLWHLCSPKCLQSELVASAIMAAGEWHVIGISSQVAEQHVGRDEFTAVGKQPAELVDSDFRLAGR